MFKQIRAAFRADIWWHRGFYTALSAAIPVCFWFNFSPWWIVPAAVSGGFAGSFIGRKTNGGVPGNSGGSGRKFGGGEAL